MVLILCCPTPTFADATLLKNDGHLDELKINANLQLHDVLEKNHCTQPNAGNFAIS